MAQTAAIPPAAPAPPSATAAATPNAGPADFGAVLQRVTPGALPDGAPAVPAPAAAAAPDPQQPAQEAASAVPGRHDGLAAVRARTAPHTTKAPARHSGRATPTASDGGSDPQRPSAAVAAAAGVSLAAEPHLNPDAPGAGRGPHLTGANATEPGAAEPAGDTPAKLPGGAHAIPSTPASASAQPDASLAAAGADAGVQALGPRRDAGEPTVANVAAPPASPAAQLAPALISLSSAGGTHRLTVQLAPDELGRVQISVSRDTAGTATVTIATERPETLALVQADSAQLHAALDKAGIASHGRSVQFHLVVPAGGGLPGAPGGDQVGHAGPANAPAAPLIRPALASGHSNPDPGAEPGRHPQPWQGTDAGGGSLSGSPAGSQPDHRQPGRPGAASTPAGGAVMFLDAATPGVITLAPGRSGLDITA